MFLNSIECDSEIASALFIDNCNFFDTFVRLRCSIRDGDFCANQDSDSISDFLIDPVTTCLSTSECSSNCRVQINRINNILGCCFNLYNTTIVAGTIYSMPASRYAIISDNSLWQECGVTPPGFCSTNPILTPSTAPTPISTPSTTPSPTPSPSPSLSITTSPSPSSAAGNTVFSVLAVIIIVIFNVNFV